MSEFLGTAFVSIQSELAKGFRANLRSQVLKAVGEGYKIPIKAEIEPFRKQLQAEARKVPILVPVKPGINVREFRSEVRRKINQATAGMRIRVPIDAVGGAGTSGTGTGRLGGGTGGTQGQAARQRALADAVGRTAQAEGLLARARASGITPAERLTRLGEAMQASQRSIESLLRQEATARDLNRNKLAQGLAAQRAKIETTFEEARAERLLLQTQVRTTAIQDAATAAKTRANRLLGVEISGIQTRDRLQRHSNALQSVEADLRRVSVAAKKAGLADLARETSALAKNTAAREASIAARRRELAAETTGQGRRAQALRGGAATGLSFAGVRGATLAAGGPFLAGAAAVAISAKAIQSAAQLEQELNVLRVTARATSGEMEAIRAKSVELGRDISLPGVSATDAAQSMSLLVRAGLEVQDAVDGAKGTLQLATAAQIEFADAAQLTASALNAFQLAGVEATRVADLLTIASNESQGEITDIGIALRQSASAAAAVGVQLDDTVALLTLLARAGLTGSDAGTSLRTAFIRLVNPTKKARDIIEQLELKIRDANGAIRPEVFGEFEQATRGLSEAQQEAARAIVFGQDAFRASALLGREGLFGLEQQRQAQEQFGAAAELAGARAQGFSGKVSALRSNLETLGTTLGETTLPALGGTVDLLNVLTVGAIETGEAIDEVINKIQELGDALNKNVPGGKELDEAAGRAFTRGLIPGALLLDTVKETGKGLKETADAMEIFEKRSVDAMINARIQASLLFKEIGQGPLTETSLNTLVVRLKAISDSLVDGDKNAQEFRATLNELIAEIVKTQSVPTNFQIRLDRGAAKRESLSVGATILDTFTSMGPAFNRLGAFWIEQVGDGMEEGVKKLNLGGTGLGRDIITALAELEGDTEGQLAGLRSQLAAATRTRIRQQRLVSTGQRPDLEDELKASIAEEKRLQDEVNAILKDRADAAADAKKDAQDAAKDAANAQEERDQAILAGFENAQQARANRLQVAQATISLADDIAATRALRKLLIKQRDSLKERIKTLELRVRARREYNQRLFELRLELEELQRQRKEEVQQQIRRGLELDIDFAETTENAAGERRARLALIKNLEREADTLRAVKKKTIEQKNRLKEIRNEIASQRKELQDISRERQRMFQELSFSFLTTQQGFAANLLGNLLPMGAIGGTVGARLSAGGGGGGGGAGGGNIASRIGANAPHGAGGTGGAIVPGPGFPRTPSAAMEEAGRVSAAQAAGGFSAAQAATLIQLTRQIVTLLGGIDGKGRHPENKREHRMTSGSYDKIA